MQDCGPVVIYGERRLEFDMSLTHVHGVRRESCADTEYRAEMSAI